MIWGVLGVVEWGSEDVGLVVVGNDGGRSNGIDGVVLLDVGLWVWRLWVNLFV